MDILGKGIILDNKDTIETYINRYYEKLYREEPYDESIQNEFLELISNKLSDTDIELLGKDITEDEIYTAVQNLNINKAPGIDGIPVEFYQKYWNIIKVVFVQIVENIVKGTLLINNQKKAIITLLPKGGDLNLLKSWRPISLICCDVKVVSKILANRIKPLLIDLISENQHCVNGRTITSCNTQLRDILYYYGENCSSGAIINLDWEKAFDRVNWVFLINIMKRLGFPDFIIKWVLTLHTNIQSVCMINGNITIPFDIKRGVRQGCPMSMIFYVLFQEPLYLAIKYSTKIIPPLLPSKQLNNIGYADDSTIIVKDDEGFVETFEIIKKFVKASNSKLNIQKTKVYGFGLWEKRLNWPIADLKVEVDYFKTLGITFSCNYNLALNNTWSQITTKIKNRIPLIRGNFYTLYQKSNIINSLLLSKVWYAAHVYPLPIEYSKQITTEIISFIWKPNYNPISRNVLYNPKIKGGIGLIDVLLKAKSIFIATIIKSFIGSRKCDIIQYYMALRLNSLFGIRMLPSKFCYNTTPYYEYSMDTIRKCYQSKKNPNVKSKEIYCMIFKVTEPRIEKMYLNFKWNFIWKKINFKYMNIYDRHIVYKYIHEILPNNKKLYNAGTKLSPNCDVCDLEETNIHMFLYCCKVQECAKVIYRLMFYFCNFNFEGTLLKLLFFEFPNIDKKIQNTICIIISSYISCIWFNRENPNYLLYKFKAKIIKEQKLHKVILKEKMQDIFTENYCNLDLSIVNHL